MLEPYIQTKLDYLYEGAPVRTLGESERVVVVSDLHMGDGSYNDDFMRTSHIFHDVFEGYYLERGFKLILNGDVEELMKFAKNGIMERWRSIYNLFCRFQEDIDLFKILGNHDPWFYFMNGHRFIEKQFLALRMRFLDADMFFLHGHQSSRWLERLHSLNRALSRTLLNPLGVRNFTLDMGHKGITRKESRLSEFSRMEKVMTFMGHTHRPLFGNDSSVPLLYNSGAAIGKRGITTLEIDRGVLKLVHWMGERMLKRYPDLSGSEPERVGSRDVYRTVLNSRPLRQIFRSEGVPF